MPINTLNIKDRVAKGFAWLNKKEPKWIDYIDVTQIDVRSLQHCPVGQLATRANGGVYQAGIWSDYLGDDAGDAAGEMGFDMVGNGQNAEPDEHRKLTAEWKRVIRAARKRKAPAKKVLLTA